MEINMRYNDAYMPYFRSKKRFCVLVGGAGCLAPDTNVVMYDGTLKKVQDVVLGDKLMGVDSTPRTVLELFHGFQEMYEVKQTKGMSYTVNKDHYLSLVDKNNVVSNIKVDDFIKYPKQKRNLFYGYNKSYERRRISLTPKGVGEYFGFMLDGDHLFLLDDFTVTRNSGKSFAAVQKLIMRCLEEPNTKHLVIRQFKSSLKQSVFALIKETLSSSGLLPYVQVNNTDMSFLFENGSQIVLSGLDDVEKLKSISEIVSITFEEASQGNRADFNQLNLRLRGHTGKYKQITLLLNPVSELHWIKEDFFDKKDDDTFTLKTTYKDNYFIDDSYIRQLEEKYAEEKNLYRIYCLGEWGVTISESAFYSKFDYVKHVKKRIPFYTNEHIHFGMDFNARPYTPALVAQIIRDESQGEGNIIWNLNIIDEIAMYNPKNTTEYCVEEFVSTYKDLIRPPVYIYGDATGRSRNPLNNLHNYEVIESILKPYMTSSSLRVPKANPSILKRRQFVNKILSGGYPIRVNIDKKCKLLIDDLTYLQEDVDGKKAKTIFRDKETNTSYQKYGHFSDILDYMLVEAFRGFYDNFEYYADR